MKEAVEIPQEVGVQGARVRSDDVHVVTEGDGGVKDLAVLLGGPAEAIPEGVCGFRIGTKEEPALGATPDEHVSTILDD